MQGFGFCRKLSRRTCSDTLKHDSGCPSALADAHSVLPVTFIRGEIGKLNCILFLTCCSQRSPLLGRTVTLDFIQIYVCLYEISDFSLLESVSRVHLMYVEGCK